MIPLTVIQTISKTSRHETVSVEEARRRSFEVRVDGSAPHRLKLGWWDDSQLGIFEEFICRGQTQVIELGRGLEEFISNDVEGRPARLRAQHSDLVILREVCSFAQ